MACACSEGKTTLIFACSGAANTGLLADQVARRLRADKVGAMTCLAAIGADLSGYMTSARDADRNIVIDGCPVACGKKILEAHGIPHEQYVMTDFGAEKGKTEITGEVITDTAAKVAAEIAKKACDGR